MPAVLTCPSCRWQQRLSDAEMLARLQALGMLRREKDPDSELIRVLLEEAAEKFSCEQCRAKGLVVADDWEDDWTEEVRCVACEGVIPAARLELLPNTRLCVTCQAKQETGSDTAEAEYCARCGGIMRVQKRGGSGVTRYRMVCTDCGAG